MLKHACVLRLFGSSPLKSSKLSTCSTQAKEYIQSCCLDTLKHLNTLNDYQRLGSTLLGPHVMSYICLIMRALNALPNPCECPSACSTEQVNALGRALTNALAITLVNVQGECPTNHAPLPIDPLSSSAGLMDTFFISLATTPCVSEQTQCNATGRLALYLILGTVARLSHANGPFRLRCRTRSCRLLLT